MSSPFERQVVVLHDTVILSATVNILGFGFVFFNVQLAHFIEMGLVLSFLLHIPLLRKHFQQLTKSMFTRDIRSVTLEISENYAE